MYNTILVPLDGSKRAERVLEHVEHLALRYDAQVVLLKVIRTRLEKTTGMLTTREVEGLKRDAESYLTLLQESLREKGIDARICIEYTPVVKTIFEVADRERVDLIAICSHGRSGEGRIFYGSVAAGILNHADRPLLIIRSRRD